MSYAPTPSLFCCSGSDQSYTLTGTGSFPTNFSFALLAFCTQIVGSPQNYSSAISIGTDSSGTNGNGNGGLFVNSPHNSSGNSGLVVQSNTSGATNFVSSPSISGETGALHQWIVSVSVAGQIMQTFYDGVQQTFGAGTVFNTSSPIALNNSINIECVGTTSNALADIYCAFPSSFFDLTVAGNLAKFWAAGAPVDLGNTGTGPTGAVPAVYLTTRPTDGRSAIQTNRGSAGGFLTFNHSGLVPFIPDGCSGPILPNGGLQTQLVGAGGL